ncbi:DNA-binding transcriptional regulator DhaR [compost metagenome]
MTTDDVLKEVFIPKIDETSKTNELYGRSLQEMEKNFIISTLRKCRGKISGVGGAAEILEIPGNTLHSKMKKLGITKADYYI